MHIFAKTVLIGAHIVYALLLAGIWTFALVIGCLMLGSAAAGYQKESLLFSTPLFGLVSALVFGLIIWKEFPVPFLENILCFLRPAWEEKIMSKKYRVKQQRRQQAALLLETRPAPLPLHPLSQLLTAIGVDHFIVWCSDGSYSQRSVRIIDGLLSAKKRDILPTNNESCVSHSAPFRLEYEVAPEDYRNPETKAPDGTRYIFLGAYEDWGKVIVQTRVEQNGASSIKKFSVGDLLTLLGKHTTSHDTALIP